MNKPSDEQILGALIESREHWYRDCVMATKENYQYAQIRDNACACCQLFKGKDGTRHCEWCPVHDPHIYECCEEWEPVRSAMRKYLDYKAFHEASIVMWQKLDRLVGEYARKVYGIKLNKEVNDLWNKNSKENMSKMPKPDKCDTCAHDFEPKQQYEVGDVVLTWNGTECTQEFALYDMTLLIVFRKATLEEARKFLNKYYSRKIGDAWARAYMRNNYTEIALYSISHGIENYTILPKCIGEDICRKIELPIMPINIWIKHSFTYAHDYYPDIAEFENDN